MDDKPADNTPLDDNAQNTQDYSSNIQFTDPPQPATSEDDPAINDTYQQADTNIDQHEAYDEGLAGAAEITPPNTGGIVGFTQPSTSDENTDGDANKEITTESDDPTGASGLS